jgi:hypothetical protein
MQLIVREDIGELICPFSSVIARIVINLLLDGVHFLLQLSIRRESR